MTDTPNFGDFQFVSAAALNSSAALTNSSSVDTTANSFTPGILNHALLTFGSSGLTLTTTFNTTGNIGPRIVFGYGVIAAGNGTTSGVTNHVYTTDLTSFVPISGNATVYIVATRSQIGQTPILITGPTPGHPDYDPTFIPYTLYTDNQDSVAVSATLSPPDNSTAIELCRTVLNVGQSNIGAIDSTKQLYAYPVQGPYFAKGHGAISGSTTLTRDQAGTFFTTTGNGITVTLPPIQNVPVGSTYGFMVAGLATYAITLTANCPIFAGTYINFTNTVTMYYGDYMCLQSDGVNWNTFSTSLIPYLAKKSGSISSSVTLTADGAGTYFNTFTNGITVTLPPINSVPDGTTYGITVAGFPGYSIFLQPSADGLFGGPFNHRTTAIPMQFQDYIFVQSSVAGGIGSWRVISMSIPSSQFPSIEASPGFQELPSGLRIQWGSGTTSGAGSATVTYAVPFPTVVFAVTATVTGGGSFGGNTVELGIISGLSGFNVFGGSPGGPGAVTFSWVAYGF